MKIIPVQQNSLEWLQARAGIPTASEFDQLVTPLFEVRKGEMPKTYLARKTAEWWLHDCLPGYQTIDMEFGKVLEEEARPWYSAEFGVDIQTVGLCTTDDGRIGCSPDGLIGDDCGIEIKCPSPHTHVKYLLNGVLPPEYAAQVHGAMLVTGRRKWVFLSYCRRYPALVLTVEYDQAIQYPLWRALEAFLKSFDEAKARLTEINGGPPRWMRVEKAKKPTNELKDPDDYRM